MMGYGILLAILFLALISMGIQSKAYAGITEWKSEYSVGILESEQSEFGINPKISTHDKNSLMVEWSKSPDLTKVTGYKIMRKTMNSDYELVSEQNSKHLYFLDRNLSDGYYGYKIIPIADNKSDKITKHGITRTNNMFKVYVVGQELIAKEYLHQMCADCFSKPFEEINNIFSYESLPRDRNDSILQYNISNEIKKASILFNNLYDVRIKH